MALPGTWRQLINRLERHVNDNFPSADYKVSQNEILLYIEEALAFSLVGTSYQMAKIEGNLVVPEGVLTTYALPALQKNNITKEWYATLPQPPLSLPLGYSITQAYFANSVDGKGDHVHFIKAKRAAYRKKMPVQVGVNARVEGTTIFCEASDGNNLATHTLYVTMAGTRVTDINSVLNVPDDMIASVFTAVVARLMQRAQLPKDIIQDDISQGNKNS